LDAPCLSAIVSGMRDEGGKGRPNKMPSVPIYVCDNSGFKHRE
jgi:hypothetical protein